MMTMPTEDKEKPFGDHVREAIASYKRMTGLPLVRQDVEEIVEAVIARRNERGWSSPPRELLDRLLMIDRLILIGTEP